MKIAGVLFVAAASACGLMPPPMARADIAILEAGDATLRSIDGTLIRTRNSGAFELPPGNHTFEISGVSFGMAYVPGIGTLCVKARGCHRYRIKSELRDRPRVYVIDTATGQPPKTPCGPDEDDD